MGHSGESGLLKRGNTKIARENPSYRGERLQKVPHTPTVAYDTLCNQSQGLILLKVPITCQGGGLLKRRKGRPGEDPGRGSRRRLWRERKPPPSPPQ